MLYPLCSRQFRRGAAGDENSPDRILREGGPLARHTARMEAFRQGLRELGYEEGKNIVIEWRFGDSKVDRLPALAAELAGFKVAVIVTGGTAPTRAAKEATSTIPNVTIAFLKNDTARCRAKPRAFIVGSVQFAPMTCVPYGWCVWTESDFAGPSDRGTA